MKKFVSLFMTVCMLSMCFGTATMVFADGAAVEEILFTDNFARTAEALRSSTEWVTQHDSNPYIDKNNATLSGNGSTSGELWVWSSTGFGYNLANPVSTGTVLVSFDVNANALVDNVEEVERTFDMAVGGESITTDNVAAMPSNKIAGLQLFKKNDNSLYQFKSGWEGSYSGTDTFAMDKNDHHFDILINLETRKATTYFDNAAWKTYDLPETFTSVNSVAFKSALNMSAVLVDNVRVIKNPSAASVGVTENTTVFNDNFDRTAAALRGSIDWKTRHDSNPYIDKNSTSLSGNGNTSGKLWVWSSTQFGYNLVNPVSTGTVLVSFDVNANALADNTETTERTFEMVIGGESITDSNIVSLPSNKIAGLQLFKKNDNSLYQFKSGWITGWSGADTVAMDKNDHHFDILIDLESRKATTYFDNVAWKTYNLPANFTSVNSVAFKSALNMSAVLVDNVKIVQKPAMVVENVSVNDALNYVDFDFNYSVTSTLPEASAVIIKNTETDATVAVTSVSNPAADIIRVAYGNKLERGNYTISLTNPVSSIVGSVTASGAFEITSLAALGETFTSTTINGTAINSWMTKTQTDDYSKVEIEDGRLKVSTIDDSKTWWENTFKMNLISDKAFDDIYKSIRKDGAFTAGTTKLGTLSYEFDVEIPNSGTTVVLWNEHDSEKSGSRHFRILSGTGFYAGTEATEKLADFAANCTYKIKVAYSFENQTVSYYLDGSLVRTTNFIDTIYKDGKKIDGNDVFGMSLGIAKGKTAYFDNFAVTYEAEDYIMQDFAATAENDGTYKVSGAVVNPFDKVNGAVVIFAAYKNDALVYVDLVDATTQAFEQTVVDETFTVPAGTDYDNVKVFAWRGLDPIRPLVQAIPLQ